MKLSRECALVLEGIVLVMVMLAAPSVEGRRSRGRVAPSPPYKATSERINFVGNLTLAGLGTVQDTYVLRRFVMADTPSQPSTDTSEQGFVDSGSLISFISGLTAQHKGDVLNSTLLAQLAANKKYDREKQTDEWYHVYHDVLENVGWVVSAFQFTKYQPGSASFKMDKALLDLIAAIATEDEVLVAKKTLDALSSLSDDDGRVVLFDSQSSSSEYGSFQIAPCAEEDGNVVMQMAACHFKANRHVTKFLFFEWGSSEISLYQASQTMVLNEGVYASVREAVANKLGHNANDYVKNLDI